MDLNPRYKCEWSHIQPYQTRCRKSLGDSVVNVTISTLKFSVVWIIFVTGNVDSLRFNSFQRFLFYWIVSDPFFLPNFAFLSLLQSNCGIRKKIFLLQYIQAVARWRSEGFSELLHRGMFRTQVESHQTGTFEGRSTDWVTSPWQKNKLVKIVFLVSFNLNTLHYSCPYFWMHEPLRTPH